MKRVVIESPYAGGAERNTKYAQRAMRRGIKAAQQAGRKVIKIQIGENP